GLWRDSFEAQTDRMSAADAQSMLLNKIRAAREKISPGITSHVPLWIFSTKNAWSPLRPSDNPLTDVQGLLYEIEDLLTPASGSFWKLQLGQRRRGKRQVPSAIAEDIFVAYGGELALEEHPRSKKIIIGDLAKEYGLTDAAVREIIRRASGKKRRKPKR